ADFAFGTILNDAAVGIKSHLLIGAYGTGKSSFLLALKQTLEGSHIHFKNFQKVIKASPDYEFISIVGDFSSFENYFVKLYKLGKGYTTSDIIKSIDKHYKANKKKGQG